MPTRSPGWNLVPRWRTMVLPGSTISPPNFLTPSRRPALSRPLREEPPAFLCAILNLLRPLLRLWLRLSRSPAPGSAVEGGRGFAGDRHGPQHGLGLAMAVLAAVIVPPLFLEDDDLVGAAMLDQGGADRRAIEKRGAGRHHGAVADHQHLAELNRRARLAGELLDGDHIVLGDLVLLAAGADDCEHDKSRYRLQRRPRQAPRGANTTRTGLPVRERRTIVGRLSLSITSGPHGSRRPRLDLSRNFGSVACGGHHHFFPRPKRRNRRGAGDRWRGRGSRNFRAGDRNFAARTAVRSAPGECGARSRSSREWSASARSGTPAQPHS